MLKVDISPEIARLAQLKVKDTGLPLAHELARSVVEEAIFTLDPELNLLVGDEDSVSEIDALVQSFGVNDVVVNGRHIDVRALDDQGKVSITRALIDTPYTANGTLVVAMNGVFAGSIVAHITEAQWKAAEAGSKADQVEMQVELIANFDLPRVLTQITSEHRAAAYKPVSTLPDTAELRTFIEEPKKVIVARQRQIIAAMMQYASVRSDCAQIGDVVTKGLVRSMLSDSALWTRRVEKMVDKLAKKFDSLSRQEIKAQVLMIGEKFGGQPEAPEFRKELVAGLAQEQFAKKLPAVSKAKAVIEQVLSGRSVTETVKDFVKNNVAVDLALEIKKRRQNVQGTVAATAEEIGMAFQQLALQPVYSTHSPDPQTGVDSINEALQLLEAGDLAEELSGIEEELLNG